MCSTMCRVSTYTSATVMQGVYFQSLFVSTGAELVVAVIACQRIRIRRKRVDDISWIFELLLNNQTFVFKCFQMFIWCRERVCC